jgi:hypothetical protein
MRRGISLGREGTWSKSGKTKNKRAKQEEQYFMPVLNVEPIFLHTTCSHFEKHGEGLEPQDTTHATTPDSTFETNSASICADDLPESNMTLRRSLLPFAFPSHESYLFDYFVSNICPSCSLSPTYNPYLYYITPISMVYPPLHNAILSVSANQLRLLSHRRFEKDAWWYKTKTLEGLRESINSGDIGWPFIATILMLCFYDIADGCNESWMIHLKSGLQIMEQVSSDFTEGQQLRKFCLMYFVAHNIMGHTAGTLQIADSHYAWLEDDCMNEIDPLMGCSRGLLDIIHTISKAASDATMILSKRCMMPDELADLRTTRNELEGALHAIDQIPSVASDSTYLTRVAEIKRQTALIYLHERLSTLLPPSTSVSSSSPASYKSSLITSVIEQLSPLPSSPTLLWPLFVLGKGSPADEGHRRFVLERLDNILKSRNLGSVRLARTLVEDRYRSWDLEIYGEMALEGKWISLA